MSTGGENYDTARLASVAQAIRDIEHPRTIGVYHILEPIGEGGMGTVYKAEQREPIHRTVALKVIKLGMDTRDVIARFESERQVLALMDHPNVARVIDAGATPGGLPYFVMEYVSGESITDFADAHQLTVRERLELFVQACDAVQHAHQKAIVHRDLKPSNILVAKGSGASDKPRVKVIDFGIAKALEQPLVQRSMFTELGRMIGTPEYMAPEQADDSLARDVDTRSDVYSLGVVLYELITGSLPFDGEQLRSAGYNEIQRIIREVDPPRPSTRLSALGEAATLIAAARRVPLAALERQLKSELEWIPLKAMRKDRADRYASATELATDVENYLANRPLMAGPEGRVYRARKFLRRNRGPVAAAALVMLALIGGVIATTYQAIRARRAETQTRNALVQVQKQKGQTESANRSLGAVNEFLARDVLGSADPDVSRGRQIPVVEALDNAARTIKGRFTQSPATEAAIRVALADAYRAIGRIDLADSHATAAMELCATSVEPDDPTALNARRSMALVRTAQGKLGEAEALLRDVKARAERTGGANSALATGALKDLGLVLVQTDRLDEAESVARDALKRTIDASGASSGEAIEARSSLANVLYVRGKLADGEAEWRAALADARRELGEDHPTTILIMSSLATILSTQGKFAQAEALSRESLSLGRRVYGEDHHQVNNLANSLAEMLQIEEKLDEAEPLFREALAKSRRQIGSNNAYTLAIVNNYARLLNAMHRWPEAEPLYREAMESGRALSGAGAPNVLISSLNYARALSEHGDIAKAEAITREALATARQSLTSDHRVTMLLMQNLGDELHQLGKDEEAEPLIRESLERRRRTLGDDHPETLGSLHSLGQFLIDRKDYARAEPINAELYQRSAASKGRARTTAMNMSQWAICLVRMGRYEQAAAPLHDVHDRLAASGLSVSPTMRVVLEALIETDEHIGRSEDGAKHRDELQRLSASTHPSSQPTSKKSGG